MKLFNVNMDTTVNRVRSMLDSTIKYLTPLLPIANCHMVEFISHNHWEMLIPNTLRECLDVLSLEQVTKNFWTSVESLNSDIKELDKWISGARSHCLATNDDYCLTRLQLEERIQSWGGVIKPQVQVTEFMSSKKSYEVQSMCNLVASLQDLCKSSCCLEVGGGKGTLLTALSLAYGVPSLTVDCNANVIQTAALRAGKIQKKWNSIAKIKNLDREACTQGANLQRFVSKFVTKDTDLAALVHRNFPEIATDRIRLLLTGLHTCGNLGPESLRIFAGQASTSAVFNVPCCYHLLTEDVDVGLYDVFQRDYCSDSKQDYGFPMSEYLKGLNLGRNARMLAAQSIDRVVRARQLPARSLLYRAMLEFVIKENLPNAIVTEGKLKKLSKCENFEDYFKMADDILGLSLQHRLPPEYLAGIRKNMESSWKKLVLFYLLRLCLAQVVEGVILLDRQLYLFENGFDKVFLVKLFDPVLSPRCHSIVALKSLL